MPSAKPKLHLNAFLIGSGHHEAAWRRPSIRPERALTAEPYVEYAQTAERGKFDSVFFEDHLALSPNIAYVSRDYLEPISLLSAIAVSTTDIGLIATASTSYNSPYDIARRFASLDHISNGRAGWNIVTSGYVDEALNFVDSRPAHDDRYARATEFTDVACALWDSWEEGALIADQSTGAYADSARVHAIEHSGEYYAVKGALNVPRSPQGRPLLVQAGSSEAGRTFAARFADAVFTAQSELSKAQTFYADMKSRAAALGRSPDELVVLPGLVAVVGSTAVEAQERLDRLNRLLMPEFGVEQLTRLLEHDMSQYPIDGPFPDLPRSVQGGQTRFDMIISLARDGGLTIRQLIARMAAGSGHLLVVGTPTTVADAIEEWFVGGACDGFNVLPLDLPDGLDDFVDLVVPELQRRGLFRTEYGDGGLRGHYGLSTPANRFAAEQ